MDAVQDRPGWWKRWRRYRVLVFFLAGLVAVDVVVAAHRDVWNAYSPDDYRARVRQCRRQRPDLLVIGGSPVSEGIDTTALTGLRWRGTPLRHPFNLGLPGATTTEVWHAVKHGAAAPPRVLVYGITASDVNDGRSEPHGPHSLLTASDMPDFARHRPESLEWCLRHWLKPRLERLWSLYHFRHGIRLWACSRLDAALPGTYPKEAAEARENLRYASAMDHPNGFAPQPRFQRSRLTDFKAPGEKLPPFNYLDHFHVGGGHVRYLLELQDWCVRHGVELVLVDMPVSRDLEESLHPREFAAYRAALAELERTRRLRVLRASRAVLDATDADFADLVHLNAHGTARLTTWLRQQLAVLGGRS